MDEKSRLSDLGYHPPTRLLAEKLLPNCTVQLDPAADLYELLRLEPRARRVRRKGPARVALDFQDAAQMVRRFLRELTGELPPDLDQVDARRQGQ